MNNNEINKVKKLTCLFDPLFHGDKYVAHYYHTDQIFELIFRYRNPPEVVTQMMGIYKDLGYKSFDPFRTIDMFLLRSFHDASNIFLSAFVANLYTFIGNEVDIMVARPASEDERIAKLAISQNKSVSKQSQIVNIQDTAFKKDDSNFVV